MGTEEAEEVSTHSGQREHPKPGNLTPTPTKGNTHPNPPEGRELSMLTMFGEVWIRDLRMICN